MTLYDIIRIVRTVRIIVTQYIEISLNLVRIYEKRSTRRSFMRIVTIYIYKDLGQSYLNWYVRKHIKSCEKYSEYLTKNG